jgi:polyhydroxybutyrate depolymerase
MPSRPSPVLLISFCCAWMFAGCGNLPHPDRLSPTSAPADETGCAAGDHFGAVSSSGQIRAYRLHVPASYRPESPAPLVLGFHGAGSNAAQFEEYSGLSGLADETGFLAVFPQGLGEPATWDTWAKSQDVQFAADLIDAVAGACSIDRKRVFAVGHSLGGGMANRLACDLAGRIAAVGSVSGAYQYGEICDPTEPVALVAFHGSDDPVIPYNGLSSSGRMPGAYYTVGVPIPEWASAWADRNGCSGEPTVFLRRADLTGQRWGGCKQNADIVLYTVMGGGHDWPQFTCDDAEDCSAVHTIWNFFRTH